MQRCFVEIACNLCARCTVVSAEVIAMKSGRTRVRQHALEFRGWGGARRGAGRKPARFTTIAECGVMRLLRGSAALNPGRQHEQELPKGKREVHALLRLSDSRQRSVHVSVSLIVRVKTYFVRPLTHL